MAYRYDRDRQHLREFLEAAKTEEGTQAYLAKYVYGPRDHGEYLELIGEERLEELKGKVQGR